MGKGPEVDLVFNWQYSRRRKKSPAFEVKALNQKHAPMDNVRDARKWKGRGDKQVYQKRDLPLASDIQTFGDQADLASLPDRPCWLGLL